MPYQNPYITSQYAPYQSYGMQQPYGSQQQPYSAQQQQPVHGFVYVTGMEGAKAYPMPPNSEMPLFDSTGDILYIKTTDGAGFPTITICDCYKRESQTGTTEKYVTKDEVDKVFHDLSSQIDQIRGVLHGTVPDATEAGEPGDRKGEGAQADGGRKPGGGVFPAHAD